MALVLRLNRGAYGTLDLNDGTNYCVLDTWQIRFAPRRVSQFGGQLYQRVIENIPLRVIGVTATACLEAVEDIIAALEQAYAWRRHAVIDPVLLEYLPNGTGLAAVLQAPVYGTPENASDLLAMAQFGMYQAGKNYETVITLPLERDGLWLGAAETPANSSTVANPGVMSVTFANDLRLPSPAKLVFNDETGYGAGSPPYHQGMVFWADQADKLILLNSNVMSPYQGVGTWDTSTESTAFGGNVRRLDVSGGADGGIGGDVSGMNADARRFAFYACIRNNSSTYSWSVRGLLVGTTLTYGRWHHYAPGNYPVLVDLGIFVLPDALDDAYILVESDGPTLAADSIEVDYFLVVAIDEFTGAVMFDDTQDTGTPNLDLLTVDPRVLTNPQGAMTHDAQFFTRTGGSILPHSVGTNLSTLVAGTTPAALGAGLWTLQHPTYGKISFSLTATRYPGYLVGK